MGSGSRFSVRFSCFLLVLTVVGLLGGSLACSTQGPGKTPPLVPPGGILLQGAGASFPAPLYKRWFAAYQKDHPQMVISYESVGSGEGIRRFMGGNVSDEEKVDFGASDAALQDNEIAQAALQTVSP